MNKENKVSAKDEERPLRITRARAKALGSLGGGIPPYSRPSFKTEHKNKPRANSKRAASDDNKNSVVAPAGLQHKRRAVLTDVTNICGKSYDKCIDTSKFQVCMKHSLFHQIQIPNHQHLIVLVIRKEKICKFYELFSFENAIKFDPLSFI